MDAGRRCASAPPFTPAVPAGCSDGDADPWPYLVASLRSLLTDERQALPTSPDHGRASPPVPSGHEREGATVIRSLGGLAWARLIATESAVTVTMIARCAAVDIPVWEDLGRDFGLSAAAAHSEVSAALARLRLWFPHREAGRQDARR